MSVFHYLMFADRGGNGRRWTRGSRAGRKMRFRHTNMVTQSRQKKSPFVTFSTVKGELVKEILPH